MSLCEPTAHVVVDGARARHREPFRLCPYVKAVGVCVHMLPDHAGEAIPGSRYGNARCHVVPETNVGPLRNCDGRDIIAPCTDAQDDKRLSAEEAHAYLGPWSRLHNRLQWEEGLGRRQGLA